MNKSVEGLAQTIMEFFDTAKQNPQPGMAAHVQVGSVSDRDTAVLLIMIERSGAEHLLAHIDPDDADNGRCRFITKFETIVEAQLAKTYRR